MTASRRSIRRAAALVTAGSACVLSTLLPVLGAPAVAADAELGSGLGSFNLSASSPAYQVRQQEPAYCFGTAAALNGCELVVPEAVATLRNGPVGLGLAATVWPGSLAANLGSLLITASNGQIPDEARMLNDPVKAEARTSTGPDTVVYDEVPGTIMKAVAKDDRTSAEAFVSGLTDPPVGTFGKSSGVSNTALKGASSAEATARSSVQDVNLGVLSIGSVTSEAKATTDGKVAKASGKTLVTGATIAGVPVTIDENGYRVNGSGIPAELATQAVNTALANANMTIAVSEPQGKPDGESVTYTAGSLVVVWKPTPDYTTTVVLGGANVSVRATQALDFSTGIVDTPGTIDPFVPSTPVVPTDTGTVGGPVTGGIDAPTPEVPGAPAPQTPTISEPVLAADKVPLVGGLSPALGVLGLVGAGLIAAGLKRLPDRVLVASAPVCLLEETA